MIKKITKAKQNKQQKASAPVQKTASVKPAKSVKWQEKMPPLFTKDVTREDKISLLSFCLGMIVMTCFFILDFQVRSSIEMRHFENRAITTLSQAIAQQKQPIKSRIHHNRRPVHHRALPAQKPVPQKKCAVWNRQAEFIPAEYAPYDKVGTLTLSGNVCAVLPAGTKCPSDITVFINPQTTYSHEWWTKHWAGTNAISKGDPRVLKYNKRVWADANGNFTFHALPAGSYYIGADMPAPTKENPCKRVRVGAKLTLDKNKVADIQIVSQK